MSAHVTLPGQALVKAPAESDFGKLDASAGKGLDGIRTKSDTAGESFKDSMQRMNAQKTEAADTTEISQKAETTGNALPANAADGKHAQQNIAMQGTDEVSGETVLDHSSMPILATQELMQLNQHAQAVQNTADIEAPGLLHNAASQNNAVVTLNTDSNTVEANTVNTVSGKANMNNTDAALALINDSKTNVATNASANTKLMASREGLIEQASHTAMEDGANETDLLLKTQLRSQSDSLGQQAGSQQNMHSLLLNASQTVESTQTTTARFSGLVTDAAALMNTVTTNSANTLVNTASASASNIYQSAISETFGQPEWGQGLGKQVMLMINQNVRTAELRMNPAHLGPIEVRIEMDDDQVNLMMSSRHTNVREAMEMALPRLREMFEQNGLQLADTDISQQMFSDNSNFNSTEDVATTVPAQLSEEDAETNEMVDTQLPPAAILGADNVVDYYI